LPWLQLLSSMGAMKELLERNELVLMEAAIVEQLRRSDAIELHPRLINAPLIYDQAGQKAMASIYHAYMDIASKAALSFLMYTPTWRANRQRVMESGAYPSINTDAVRFMQGLREAQGSKTVIKIGGLIGCKNDCYRPEEALSAAESELFHAWQIAQLAIAGVDFLIAQTLPSVEEAKGIAKAMELTGLPYVISFVISRDGSVLDGTDLDTAIAAVDAVTERKPLGFMVNCAYPGFLCAEKQKQSLFDRLIGYQGNASSLDHKELDGADTLQAESVTAWGDAMLELHHSYGVKMLGGCCGTGVEHLRYIVGKR